LRRALPGVKCQVFERARWAMLKVLHDGCTAE
jgi:hypothetical protein